MAKTALPLSQGALISTAWYVVVGILLSAIMLVYALKYWQQRHRVTTGALVQASVGQKLRLSQQSVLIEVIINQQSQWLIESSANIKALNLSDIRNIQATNVLNSTEQVSE